MFSANSQRKKVISIKHDLVRSCFQFWPKIGDEGDKILREKIGSMIIFSLNFDPFSQMTQKADKSLLYKLKNSELLSPPEILI